MIVNIDSTELLKHTERLNEINRSAFPVSIRGALNDSAYDVKKRTMPEKAKVFKKRAAGNFFKANSKVEGAKGFDVTSMKATVGFYENKLVNAKTNYAVKDLEQQEHGGDIDGKSLIAMRSARVGNKMVKNEYKIPTLKDKKFLKMTRRGNGRFGSVSVKSKKQQFIRAAIYARQKFGEDAFVLGNKSGKGFRTLNKINNISLIRGRYTFAGGGGIKNISKVKIERTPIYRVRKGNVEKVNPTNFMKRASLETGLQISKFFIAQAEKQFNKLRK